MKITSVNLLYNAAAHFAAAEKYPEGLMKELNKPNVDSFEAVVWAFAECAKQAELMRRFMGEKPRKIPTEDEWKLILQPGQLRDATEMVIKAVLDGLGEHDDDEEVDLVLEELNKEKKTR